MQPIITQASVGVANMVEDEWHKEFSAASKSKRKKMLAEKHNAEYEIENTRRETVRVGGRRVYADSPEAIEERTLQIYGGRRAGQNVYKGVVLSLVYVGLYSGLLTVEDVYGKPETAKSFGRVGIVGGGRGRMSATIFAAIALGSLS